MRFRFLVETGCTTRAGSTRSTSAAEPSDQQKISPHCLVVVVVVGGRVVVVVTGGGALVVVVVTAAVVVVVVVVVVVLEEEDGAVDELDATVCDGVSTPSGSAKAC